MTRFPLPSQTLTWLNHAANAGQRDAQALLHLIARADAQDQWFAKFTDHYSKTIAALCRRLAALERGAKDPPAAPVVDYARAILACRGPLSAAAPAPGENLATPPAPDAPGEALAARPLLEKVARLDNSVGITVAEVRQLARQVAEWLRSNPPGQPVAIEPRGCPTPGACSCVEPIPPAPEPAELAALRGVPGPIILTGFDTFLDAIRLAEGCHDYSGGYTGAEGEAWHGAIDTVVAVLKKATDGPWDGQLKALYGVGVEAQAGELAVPEPVSECPHCGYEGEMVPVTQAGEVEA